MMRIKESDIKVEATMTALKVRCECGHTIVITKQNPVKICSHCGNIVYRDFKEYFKWRLNPNRKALKRG